MAFGYANKIQGNVAATNASIVNAESKHIKQRAVVQILRLRLRWGWTRVITILILSSSTMGRPSALMIKIWEALWLGLTSLWRFALAEIPLKQRAIQFSPLGKLFIDAVCALWRCPRSPSGMGTGTSSVCCSSRFFSVASETTTSFCFLMNVRCRQMGQMMVSLIIPSLLTLTRVLTKQSWQNTCPQLKILSVPDRHS